MSLTQQLITELSQNLRHLDSVLRSLENGNGVSLQHDTTIHCSSSVNSQGRVPDHVARLVRDSLNKYIPAALEEARGTIVERLQKAREVRKTELVEELSQLVTATANQQ